jgi:hypothetical protein
MRHGGLNNNNNNKNKNKMGILFDTLNYSHILKELMIG